MKEMQNVDLAVFFNDVDSFFLVPDNYGVGGVAGKLVAHLPNMGYW